MHDVGRAVQGLWLGRRGVHSAVAKRRHRRMQLCDVAAHVAGVIAPQHVDDLHDVTTRSRRSRVSSRMRTLSRSTPMTSVTTVIAAAPGAP